MTRVREKIEAGPDGTVVWTMRPDTAQELAKVLQRTSYDRSNREVASEWSLDAKELLDAAKDPWDNGGRC